VSDERDGADAPSAITPRRPTGKRTRQRALVGGPDDQTEAIELESAGDVAVAVDTEPAGKAKPAKKKKSGSDASRNPFVFVFNYLKQVVAELRKVIWPNRKQMVSYTTVVLAFLVFMVALIGAVDLGLAKLVLLVFG
jgi:preprotein translocase subunit SecE